MTCHPSPRHSDKPSEALRLAMKLRPDIRQIRHQSVNYESGDSTKIVGADALAMIVMIGDHFGNFRCNKVVEWNDEGLSFEEIAVKLEEMGE